MRIRLVGLPASPNPNPLYLIFFLGGLGSYTPSKIPMADAPFELGVSRTTPAANSATAAAAASSGDPPSTPDDTYLRPADQGISWGNTTSSDMLF